MNFLLNNNYSPKQIIMDRWPSSLKKCGFGLTCPLMSNFKRNVIFSAVVVFILFLAFRYYGAIEGFLSTFLDSLTSIAVGAVMAYVMNLPMTFFETRILKKVRKGRRVLSILLSIFVVVIIVALIFSYIIPRFIESLTLLINSLPLFLSDLSELASDNLDPYIESLSTYLKPLENLRAFLTERRDIIVSEIFNLVGSLLGLIVSLVLSLAFAIYMLAGKERIIEVGRRLMNAYLGRKRSDSALAVLSKANSIFKRFFVGQLTEATILGSLSAAGMIILRLPYAGAIGALIAVTALIPIAGAWIGAIVGAIMIFPISPVKSLVFLIFLLILQQTENNVIYPRVVGSSIGLPGIWVLAAITIGGGIGGVAGMLVAVPTVALIVALVSEDAEKRLNERESNFADSL